MSLRLWRGAWHRARPKSQRGQEAARDLQPGVSAWPMETACGPLFTEPISPLMDAAGRSLFASFSWEHESRSVWRTRALPCQTFRPCGGGRAPGSRQQSVSQIVPRDRA